MARQFASVHKHSLLLFLLVCYGHDTLAYSPSRTRYLLLANGSTRYSASPSWFGVVRASVSGPASLSLSLSLSFSLSLSPARLWKLRYALCHYPLLSFSVASLRGTSPELPVSFAIRQYPVSSFSSFFFSPSPSLSLSLSLSLSPAANANSLRFEPQTSWLPFPWLFFSFSFEKPPPPPSSSLLLRGVFVACRKKISKVEGKFRKPTGTISSGDCVVSPGRFGLRALRDVSDRVSVLEVLQFQIREPTSRNRPGRKGRGRAKLIEK